MKQKQADILIIGSGIAGLSAALSAAPASVILVSADQPQSKGSTSWAQGGIAAALSKDDSPEKHAQDTIDASGGAVDEERIRWMTEQGKQAIAFLEQQGVKFDYEKGQPALTKEGAHSCNRVLHARGDATGAEIYAALAQSAEKSKHIQWIKPACLTALRLEQNAILGGRFDSKEQAWQIHADKTILSTGGYAGLYEKTSVPASGKGFALSLAMMAGVRTNGLEFVQFHPTCLQTEKDPMPLISEAVRGEGAVLINQLGERFMDNLHPLKELAPRDQVSRAIWKQLSKGNQVYLDARTLPGKNFKGRFPGIWQTLKAHAINPEQNLIPITPACHYTMGGIVTDQFGQTSLPGLYACGEVAWTGVHGANRLASNSLLEGVVFGTSAGKHAAASLPINKQHPITQAVTDKRPSSIFPEVIRQILWRYAGINRDQQGLSTALQKLQLLNKDYPNNPYLHLATAIVQAASKRKDSIGSHFRSDAPSKNAA